ncbi:hypothetical protein EVAR_85396_1 [Eumeta japonica]|uniref:Pre-C2HC domain-containing protein n=1 Tax=Eumeta variegata TaxID=151549 RepID=A0A4C1SJW4_EUMVA|nr:hypothetical protein EVAR_85396_1 [Eumeta japonica]
MKAAYHTYSLKEEREFRVVLKGVPKEFPLDEVKDDLLAQKLPVRAVRRVTNRNREPLDLVLVSADPSAKDSAKAIFFKIKTVCSLSGIKVELPHCSPGQLSDVRHCGVHQSKENGPPACVLCNIWPHGQLPGMPAPKKYPTGRNNRDNNSHPNDKAARAGARASGLKNATYANVTAGAVKTRLKPKAMCLRTH